jgi:hypothetical protein
MGIIKFIKPTEFRVFPNMSHSHFPKQWRIKQQGFPMESLQSLHFEVPKFGLTWGM